MSHVFSSPPPYQRVCRRSSHSSVTSQWHIWQEASVCVCVRERGLNVLPSTDLWILTFYTPVKPHLEVAPLVFSPLQPLDLSPPPLPPVSISHLLILLYWVTQISESPRGRVTHPLTFLPLELSKTLLGCLGEDFQPPLTPPTRERLKQRPGEGVQFSESKRACYRGKLISI